MLSVKNVAQKILEIMVVNYCWLHLARRLWWAAPAYQKKQGTSPHPGACKLSLQYDGRSDWRLGVWFKLWNLGSLSGKGEKFVKNL